MGRDFYDNCLSAREIFDRAEARRPGIQALCFEGPPEALNQTINTQPCLYVTDLACAAALSEAGVRPDGVAGFSLGELAAAAFTGVLCEKTGLELVVRRATAMQRAGEANPGTMFAVVKLTTAEVEMICQDLAGAYAVNYNCPDQIVVACELARAPELVQAVAAAGGRALPLKVSGAFHSPLMSPAAEDLALWLESVPFGFGKVPLYANATARPYGDPAALLARQIDNPVLWQLTIENLIGDGFDRFVEVGPGKALSGFIRKIDPGVTVTNVCDQASLAEALEVLGNA
jgi:[acyl-carrier-protein] S-malonyltransferase